MWGANPRAKYDQAADSVQITGYGQNYQCFVFTVKHPATNRPAPIDNVTYYPPLTDGSFYYGGTDLGEIILTRFDLTARIVSGTFHFTGYRKHYTDPEKPADQNDFVTVTFGRFDMKIDIIH